MQLKNQKSGKKNYVKLFSTYVSFFVSSCEKTLFNITHNIAGPPHALSHWEDKEFFKKGQPQGRLKQLNVEQDPDHNTR